MIASRYRLQRHLILDLTNIFSIEIEEMNKKEIRWLFMELIKIKNLSIDEKQFNNLLPLLNGHPEQVLYLSKLLELDGYKNVFDNSYKIVEFNTDKLSYILNKYKENDKAKNLLVFLSNFDFIDYELFYTLLENKYNDILKDFIIEHICYEIGANKEYITLSKPVKDIIVRSDWKLESTLQQLLKQHSVDFFATFKTNDKTLADYFYSIKENLINNPNTKLREIIPSHILKAIITLYDKKRHWDDVIALSERALYDSDFNFDFQIEVQIRKYLCLAYIRKRKYDDFKNEVRKIKDSSHDFLYGFYYRLTGQYDKAIERFNKVLERNPKFDKGRRELAQTYLAIFDFKNALDITQENYYQSKQNQYSFQAYSNCLLKTYNDNKEQKDKELQNIFKDFEKFTTLSSQAEEMYKMEKAKYLAVKGEEKALEEIDDIIKQFDSIYPILAKFDIADKLDNNLALEEAFDMIKDNKEKLPNSNIYSINEIILLAKKGNKSVASLKLNSLKNHPEYIKNNIKKRLEL